MNRNVLVRGVVSLFLVTSAWSETPSTDPGAIKAVADGFRDALRRGDAKAAMAFLAPDAVILENGAAETRGEYEKHHLTEDIAFSRAVTSVNSAPVVHIEGDTAWISSTNHATGTFSGRPVNSAGAELMVLTKFPSGWRIRAIHWSSHKITDAE